MTIVIKSQETREGVIFRLFKNEKYVFAELPFQNYFYIKLKDYNLFQDEFEKAFAFCIGKVEYIKEYAKIYLSNNFMRVKVREFWEIRANTYEADIKANKRFLLDKSITLNNEKILYTFFDIETDDRLPMSKDEKGQVIAKGRILSFAAVDNSGETFFISLEEETDNSEKELLTEILKYFGKYGMISGWHSEGFDMPYIKQRCDALNISYKILDFINHLDYLQLYKKYTKKSLQSYSLNSVSNMELDESKLEQKKGGGAIYNRWKTDLLFLRAYNIQDAFLVYKINLKLSFVEVSMKRADNAGCHIRNTMNNSDSGDFLLMREYKKHNIIMPSQPTREQKEERQKKGKIGGGYTTCFKPGLHYNVHVLDFKSEYPSVIQTWNISPETFIEKIQSYKENEYPDYFVTPSDFENFLHPHRLFSKSEGVIPRAIKILIEKRDAIKYNMKQYKVSDPAKFKQMYLEQYAYKTDANSIYGILSFPSSRYYNWDLGDSVTTCARATLKACMAALKSWGCEVIGGDTDSAFIKITNDLTPEILNEKMKNFINDWTKQWNLDTHKLVFEHEEVRNPFFFVKKKHYAYIDENKKLVIKGMESIKADTNPLAAKLQKQFITEILTGEYNETIWIKKIEDLYNRVYNQGLLLKELILIKALTKMPDNYIGEVIDKKTKKPKIKANGEIQMKAIPAHVQLARRLLSQGIDLFPGSKIPFVVVKNKPILALSPEEYEKNSGIFDYKYKKKGWNDYHFEGGYDADYYWLRLIKPLIKVVYCYYGRLPEWCWQVSDSVLHKMLSDTGEADE